MGKINRKRVATGGGGPLPRITSEAALAPGDLGILDDAVSAPQLALRRSDGTMWYGTAFTRSRTTSAGGSVASDQNEVTYPEGSWSSSEANVWFTTLQARMLSLTALDAVFGGSYHAPFRPNAVGAALAVGETTASIAPGGVITLYIRMAEGQTPGFPTVYLTGRSR